MYNNSEKKLRTFKKGQHIYYNMLHFSLRIGNLKQKCTNATKAMC